MTLLQVHNLSLFFSGVEVVKTVSFAVQEGEIVGIVGESGSGKSSTVQAIPRLLPAAEIKGEILFEGEDLVQASTKRLREIRGKKIGISFQDPGASLTPTMRIGAQIEEVAKGRGLELLQKVETPDPMRIFRSYPHELSGGMKQRAALAIALARSPKLLIADEPTTALDPGTKEEILALLAQKSLASTLLIVSHDLLALSQICDRLLVFYGGKIIEEGKTDALLQNPQQPYTKMLCSLLNT